MDVARAADPGVVGLGHERDRLATLLRHLLDPVLVDDVVVGHRDRIAVAEVEFLLTRPGLALGGLDTHAGCLHVVAYRADERLVIAGGEDVVVEDVRHRRRQIPVVLGMRLCVGLLDEEELQLGAEHRLVAKGSCPLHLRFEHLPGRRPDGRAVIPGHVTEDKCCALQPGNAAHGREVGNHREVAVAALPARDLIPGYRVHLHLEGEEIVAALDRILVLHLLEKEMCLHALAHQASLHVGERDDHGVDLAGLDLLFQFVEREHRSAALLAGVGGNRAIVVVIGNAVDESAEQRHRPPLLVEQLLGMTLHCNDHPVG